MKRLIIQSNVELFFGRDLLGLISTQSKKWGHRTAFIADQNVPHQMTEEMILIDSKKTREGKQQLEDRLFEKGFGRDSVFVAIGGGTVTDLVGFVAATYMRGVPLILVPTTLLAMVDAAIGGKTAIDTPFGKNLIGAFYLPKAIFIDLNFLNSLPQAELSNGLSEILKIALVFDPSILRVSFEEQIIRSIQAKVSIVEQDPQEKGIRRILNFGHTVGHAIELCAQFAIAHGEAVALGCIAESYLSLLLGHLSSREFEAIAKLFPKYRWSFDPQKLIQAMSLDKKSSHGAIRFVLLDKIGHACAFDGAYCTEVPRVKLLEMCTYMEQNYG